MISQHDLDEINDLFWGKNFDIKLDSSDICPHCRGDGYFSGLGIRPNRICGMCDGTGLIEKDNNPKTKQ